MHPRDCGGSRRLEHPHPSKAVSALSLLSWWRLPLPDQRQREEGAAAGVGQVMIKNVAPYVTVSENPHKSGKSGINRFDTTLSSQSKRDHHQSDERETCLGKSKRSQLLAWLRHPERA